MVESLPSKQVVAGSSPVSRFWARSSVVERSAHNRLVAGSNPAEPTFEANISEKTAYSFQLLIMSLVINDKNYKIC